MTRSHIFIDFEFFASIVNKKYNVTVIEGMKAIEMVVGRIKVIKSVIKGIKVIEME